jgi:hypothetical protein
MIHPHHDVILAYLDNKQVQFYYDNKWVDLEMMSDRVNNSLNFPSFPAVINYRTKPATKPDYDRYTHVARSGADGFSARQFSLDNLKLTFDGETNQLKSASILHEQKAP